MTDLLEASGSTQPTITLGVYSRDDLEVFAQRYETYLVGTAEDLLAASDKYIELATRDEQVDAEGDALKGYPRLPLLSAINGYEFVAGLPHVGIQKIVYSDEYRQYAEDVRAQTPDIGALERHFFTDGLVKGVRLKRSQQE